MRTNTINNAARRLAEMGLPTIFNSAAEALQYLRREPTEPADDPLERTARALVKLRALQVAGVM